MTWQWVTIVCVFIVCLFGTMVMLAYFSYRKEIMGMVPHTLPEMMGARKQ